MDPEQLAVPEEGEIQQPEQAAGESVNNPENQQTPEQQAQDAAGDDDREKHGLPKGVKKRIDKLTRRNYEYQRALEEERRRIQELEERLRRLENPPAPKPQRENFDTEEDYLEALTDWKLEQRLQTSQSQQPSTETNPEAGEQPQTPALPEEWQDQVEAAMERYEDFEQVALNPALPVSDAMAEIITQMDDGAEVLYHLGQNPAEAARIAQLPPLAAARELGRIEAALSSTAKPNTQQTAVSNAPPPPNPVSTGKSDAGVDPDRMTPEEYRKWREAQWAAKFK